jgi:N-acetylglucosamine-6-phosphate deacetylase
MRLGVASALVDGDIVPGDVEVVEGVITGVGLAPAGRSGLAVPGFVDVQVNGFGGVDFATADVDGYRVAAEAMARTGVTTFLPTIISLPIEAMVAALRAFETARPHVVSHMPGMHLEGPFLSPVRCGAHDPANMAEPSIELVDRLLATGTIAHLTLAPERLGALEAIEQLVAAGVTVGIGHSEATGAEAHAAFDAGARSVTHLFNAQRPWSHRDPGIAGAALVRDDVFLTVIVDGVHLHPDAVRLAARCAGERLVLITDAIAATGMGDGTYPLGDRTVTVEGAEARLEDGTLAGSVLTMDQAVRKLIDFGLDPVAAIAAATTAPAALVRRTYSLAPGNPADLVVLDDGFEVVATYIGGFEAWSRET